MPAKHCAKALVVENKPLGGGIFKMIAEWPYGAEAGQFFMVRGWDKYPLLSRPISVHDADEKTVTDKITQNTALKHVELIQADRQFEEFFNWYDYFVETESYCNVYRFYK